VLFDNLFDDIQSQSGAFPLFLGCEKGQEYLVSNIFVHAVTGVFISGFWGLPRASRLSAWSFAASGR
jgi:hypothetical protein